MAVGGVFIGVTRGRESPKPHTETIEIAQPTLPQDEEAPTIALLVWSRLVVILGEQRVAMPIPE